MIISNSISNSISISTITNIITIIVINVSREGLYETAPHGAICAALLPYVFRKNVQVCVYYHTMIIYYRYTTIIYIYIYIYIASTLN
jgi:hypothetical protein